MKTSNHKRESHNEITRRNFVKTAATGTAAITLLPNFTVSGLGHVAPSDKLLIAAVGCGGEGADDIRHYSIAPKKNAEIAFLCDVDNRMAAPRIKEFPKAKFYHDWREMFDKESKNFDAVSVAIPDHNHAIVGLSAMQLKKHLYLQKPLTHDIYEARILTQASEKYQVVTQMGDQGASCDGMRTLREWIEAGILGDIEKVFCWTDRPVWPQGIPWPKTYPAVPAELKWDLWLGTAEETDYIDNMVPFNWRGWWRFGTGALGDMGCHIIGPPFKLLNLGYPTEVSCNASTVYTGIFKEGIFPDSGPVSSAVRFKYEMKNGRSLDLFWMDGGITPERPYEIEPDVNMNDVMGDWPGLNDYEGATLFIGTKGKAACGWGGRNPILLPLTKNKDINIPKKYPRVTGDMDGHWWQWIDACIAGYGNAEVDSPFVGYAGPLTETVLMGNLLLRCFNIQKKITRKDPVYGEMEGLVFPGRYISYKWDGANMRITNFEQANQFVRREYRKGWGRLNFDYLFLSCNVKQIIYNDYRELSVKTAEMIAGIVTDKPDALLCFPAGETSVGTFKFLIELNKTGQISFRQCKIVGLDEWAYLGKMKNENCFSFLKKNLFNQIDYSEENLCFFDGESDDLVHECMKTDKFINENGPVDMILLGAGMNGHLGLNEPGTSFDLYSHIVDLDETTKIAGQKYFSGKVKLTVGITLGVNYIMEAKTVILQLNGAKKAEVVRRLIDSEISSAFPASAIKAHLNSYLLLDKDAARYL